MTNEYSNCQRWKNLHSTSMTAMSHASRGTSPPDVLFLYAAERFGIEDTIVLSELGLSRNIIALNGELESERGSAFEARMQTICARVLVLWQAHPNPKGCRSS